MRRLSNDECYLCGEKATTDDHVPPKCLSPNTPDSEFWILRACSSCNNKYSAEESKFRDILAAGTAYWQPSAGPMWQKTLRNFSPRPGRGNAPIINKQRILNNLVPILVRQSDGKVKLMQQLKHPADVDSRAVTTKIAKGLFFAHQRYRVDESVKVKYYWLNNLLTGSDLELLLRFPIRERVGDFFQYIGGVAEDGQTSAWLMRFHNALDIVVTFFAPSTSPK